ncbi:TonB-dependent receptor [Pedobacter nyackensis]|uniref:TonB-dependent receptor n=1 Tax=Pedobacter nyackensis TaxID=475255 RepID=UPI00292FF494|nr:TonB-dependent receptor [Pedobacter nyackensis]
MKLIVIMVMALQIGVYAGSKAQQVTLSVKKASLREVFSALNKQTKYRFLYNEDVISKSKPVTFQVKDTDIRTVLSMVLERARLTYNIRGETITIVNKAEVGTSSLQEQSKKIFSGKVTDTLGKPIPGVIVVDVNNSKVGTQTDNNGNFVIELVPPTVLKFSFVGFLEKRVAVTSATTTINLILSESSVQADEVVITAYGRKEAKEALVGSVTTVKPGNLKIPASNLTNALAGQVAGVIAYTPSGQPGQDNANFFIRGVTTFGYRQEPLILIDNVELTTTDLARLNVDDIESFSVLKDASATALYGARGGNGVILVKTKEGRSGKASINVRLENSTSSSVKSLELADPITYMKMLNEATSTRFPLNPLPYSQNKIFNTDATLKGTSGSNEFVYPATDWMAMLFKKRTNTQRGNVSVSGGGGVAKYYVAGSMTNDNGILQTDIRNNNNNNVNYKNYQLRSNVNINLTEKTELIVRLSGTFNDYRGPLTGGGGIQTDLYNLAMHTSPVDFPAYYSPDLANSRAQHILFGNRPSTSSSDGGVRYLNPYAELLRGNQNYTESRMLAQLEFNQKLDFLTEGLNFHAIMSTNRYSYFRSYLSYSPYYYQAQNYDKASNSYELDWINSFPTGGNVAREYLAYTPLETRQSKFLYLQGLVDYNHDFGNNHTLSAALISTLQETRNSNASNLFESLPFRNQTVAGRLTYSYKSKYFLEGNFGYNGSERFSENHRYGFFPTIGASWVMSNESFWGNLGKVVDRFKIRGSYGLVGNDAISSRRFFYLSDVNLNGGSPAWFGTNNGYLRNGVSINNYQNDEVTWEESRQANLGVEFTVLKMFNVIAEVYQNNKSNILQNRVSIPTTMGLESQISANIGKAVSRGVDLQVYGQQSFGKDLNIGFRGNLTYSENEYTAYEENDWRESYRSLIGQPINRQFGFIAERLFVDDKEAANSPRQVFTGNGRPPMGGDIKYRDLNNDGKVDFADQTFIGNPTVPQLVYGFGLSVTWKNFDLSGFFQGQAKVSFFINPNTTSPFIRSDETYFTGDTQLLKAFAEDHWSEDNQNLYALYPRFGPTAASIENNRQPSTWWLRNGSFLRLKSAELGFTLPQRLATKLGVSKTRIYLNGLNLLTWSPFKLWDAELGGNGFAYPIQKVFNLGLNVNL